MTALGVGIAWLSPGLNTDADHLYFEFDGDSRKPCLTICENHFNTEDFANPWEKWIPRNEKRFHSAEDCLERYIVDGKPLKSCISGVTALMPM